MGAYTIVDLKKVSLSGTPVTITGTYARIGSTKEAKLVKNINYGGTIKDNAYLDFTASGSGDSAKYQATYGGKVITVTVADAVSIADPE